MPLTLLTLSVACDDQGTDADGDGWTIEDGDCDDTDASVYPSAMEESDNDNWDQDCDGPGQ